MDVKTVIGVIAVALGAAALLVLVGGDDGPRNVAGASIDVRADERLHRDDCIFCLQFELDDDGDDD